MALVVAVVAAARGSKSSYCSRDRSVYWIVGGIRMALVIVAAEKLGRIPCCSWGRNVD